MVGHKSNLQDMVFVPGGSYRLGSDDFYPEERPARLSTTPNFWMDQFPVTVAAFRTFVRETGYQTTSERGLGYSLVFEKPDHPLQDLSDPAQWWKTAEATWKFPFGKTREAAHDNHPVSQVSHEDAEAFASWKGKLLPTEEEWEVAARGGLVDTIFAWGNEPKRNGQHLANTWQGQFPYENLLEDGYETTSPVGSFPENGYGLFDMIGNVWEWTSDTYRQDIRSTQNRCCQAPTAGRQTRWTIKGGSYLCAPNYCLRYRPAARSWQESRASTCHIGFRCIIRV